MFIAIFEDTFYQVWAAVFVLMVVVKPLYSKKGDINWWHCLILPPIVAAVVALIYAALNYGRY